MARSKQTAAQAADESPIKPIANDVEEYHLQRIVQAKIELDAKTKERQAVNGVYRGLIKEAKRAGLNSDGINEAIKIRTMDPEEFAARERARNRYLTLMGFPIGFQPDMFEQMDPQTESNVTAPADQLNEETATAQGKIAGRAGKDMFSNPYNEREQPALYIAWKAGWREGQTELANENFGGSNQPAATAPAAPAEGTVTEVPKKRGRGRPRKNPPPGGVIQPPGTQGFPPVAGIMGG